MSSYRPAVKLARKPNPPNRQHISPPFKQNFQPQRQQHQPCYLQSPTLGPPNYRSGVQPAYTFQLLALTQDNLRAPPSARPSYLVTGRSDSQLPLPSTTPAAKVYQTEAHVNDRKEQPAPPGDILEEEGEREYYMDEEQYNFFVGFVGVETVGANCKKVFSSKTILHKQLVVCFHLLTNTISHSVPVQAPDTATVATFLTPNPAPLNISVIRSVSTPAGFSTGFSFRGWSYATVAVAFSPTTYNDADPDSRGCLDTGCGVTLIDRNWLACQLPSVSISKMATPLKVRGIGSSKH